MPKALNLIGQKFGLLTVLEQAESQGGKTRWKCLCDCGNEKIVRGIHLTSGNTKSCGCYRGKQINNESLSARENYLNKKFNLLTIIETDNFTSHKCKCLCKCGNITTPLLKDVISGHTKSCGCLLKIANNLINEIGNKYGKLTVLERNGNAKSDNQAIWKCQCECGGIINVTGGNLRQGLTISCGCISSKGEYKIAQLLKENNINFIKQYTFEDCKGNNGGTLKFDFAIINSNNEILYLIEYDGIQHFEEIDYFKSQTLEERQQLDKIKDDYCKQNDIRLIRINYKEDITIQKLV